MEALPHFLAYRLQNPKWLRAGSKMANLLWKKGNLGGLWTLRITFAFDLCVCSMKNIDYGEMRKKEKEMNCENSGPLMLLSVDRLTARQL